MKSWVSSAFDTGPFKPKQSNELLKKTLPQKIASSNQVNCKSKRITDTDLLLCDKYEPKTRSELMVNKAKVDELSNYIDSNLINKQSVSSILLLNGPPGCGKTVTLKVLCKEKNVNLIIWNTQQFKLDMLNNNEDDKRQSDHQSQLVEFEQFLFKSSRYNTDQIYNLNNVRDKTVLLVKEIPNAAFTNELKFKEILFKFHKYSKCLLVFSYDLTTTKATWSTNPLKLFTNELKNELKIHEILFNSFANSFLVKALNRIIQLEGLKNIDKAALDDLCSMCNGDLRFAINSLEFYFTTSNISKNNKINTNDDGNLKLLVKTNNKDLNLNLFKGLGKILHRKHYDKANNDDYSIEKHKELDLIESKICAIKKKRQPLSQQPEDIYNKLSISNETIILFLHQNYIDMLIGRSYKLLDQTFDSIISISESFCLSDYIIKQNKLYNYNNTYATDYSSLISMRSLLFNLYLNTEEQKLNTTGGKGIFKPLYKPFYNKLNDTIKKRKIHTKQLFEGTIQNTNDFYQLYLPYINLLQRKSTFNKIKHTFKCTNEQKQYLQAEFQFNQKMIKLSNTAKLNVNDEYIDDCHNDEIISYDGVFGKEVAKNNDNNSNKLVKNRLYQYDDKFIITEVNF